MTVESRGVQPRLRERIKINMRSQRIDFFEHTADRDSSPLFSALPAFTACNFRFTAQRLRVLQFLFPLWCWHRRPILGGACDDGDHRRRHSHIAHPGIWRTRVRGDGFQAVVFGAS